MLCLLFCWLFNQHLCLVTTAVLATNFGARQMALPAWKQMRSMPQRAAPCRSKLIIIIMPNHVKIINISRQICLAYGSHELPAQKKGTSSRLLVQCNKHNMHYLGKRNLINLINLRHQSILGRQIIIIASQVNPMYQTQVSPFFACACSPSG